MEGEGTNMQRKGRNEEARETKEEERRVTLWVHRDVSRSPDAAPENASGAEVATSTALSRAEEQRDSISATLSL